MLPTATYTRSKLTFVSPYKYKIIWKISRGTRLWTLNKERGSKHWSAGFFFLSVSYSFLSPPHPTEKRWVTIHQPKRVFPAPLHWVELPVCWAVVSCQKGVSSATSFINALKWRFCPFPWAHDSSQGRAQVLDGQFWISQKAHSKEEHAPFAPCLGFLQHVHSKVCLEKYNSLCWRCRTREWLQRAEGQAEKMACIHCCVFLEALLVLGIPPVAWAAFWNTGNRLRNRQSSFKCSGFCFLKNLNSIRDFWRHSYMCPLVTAWFEECGEEILLRK